MLTLFDALTMVPHLGGQGRKFAPLGQIDTTLHWFPYAAFRTRQAN